MWVDGLTEIGVVLRIWLCEVRHLVLVEASVHWATTAIHVSSTIHVSSAVHISSTIHAHAVHPTKNGDDHPSLREPSFPTLTSWPAFCSFTTRITAARPEKEEPYCPQGGEEGGGVYYVGGVAALDGRRSSASRRGGAGYLYDHEVEYGAQQCSEGEQHEAGFGVQVCVFAVSDDIRIFDVKAF